MYEIEDILVKKGSSKYPTDDLPMGKSFFIPETEYCEKAARQVAAHATRRLAPKRFASTKDVKDGVPGIRIGRIA